MSYVIRCETTTNRSVPLYSVPIPTLEEAHEKLVAWKRREDWLSLEIWEFDAPDTPNPRKPKRVHREERRPLDA